MAEPDQYNTIIKDLVATKKILDNYLIQLFNRVYLNYHPNQIRLLTCYLIPRYETGQQ